MEVKLFSDLHNPHTQSEGLRKSEGLLRHWGTATLDSPCGA